MLPSNYSRLCSLSRASDYSRLAASLISFHCMNSFPALQSQNLHSKDSHSIMVTKYCAKMKGTKVPNPWRSSAFDCTCVLTRIDHSLNSSTMMFALELIRHAFRYLSVLESVLRARHLGLMHNLWPMCSSLTTEFLTLFHRPCATYL